MGEQTVLAKKREGLRREMRTGRYRALPGVILDETGRLVRTLTARLYDSSGEISRWYSGALIGVVTLLVGLIISILLGETLSSLEIQFAAWMAAMGSLLLIANKQNIDMFLGTFSQAPLDALQSVQDVDDIQRWLRVNTDPKLPLALGVVLGPALGLLIVAAWSRNNDQVLHAGPLVIAMLASVQAVLVVYYILPFYIALPGRLNHYRFKLYAADPSSSMVVDQLSDLFTRVMYITVFYVIIVLLGLTYFELLTLGTSLILAGVVWIPAVALYASGQRNLSQVISKAKWETLQQIQDKVEALQAEEEIPSPARLEHLDKLMDYHDRIRQTQTSAVNLRARLNFLNSLLLPLIAFVLSNSNVVVDLFQWIRDRLNLG